ncbi:rRNA-binding ribosome biosynthesis protein rpf2 [Nowakowskiella sp. JEL0078]|nr:rRNA-binding ribosome biosynthesis protein rpf2 [Nowakowskiella sp. JEL0078]
MIKVKARSAAGKRIQKQRESQLIESVKIAMFVRGSSTSNVVGTALKDLYSLKKPDAVYFSKKNEIHPFEDTKPLEFFAQKNDASLFVVANHSKKRPNNLTFIRTFDYQVLDMLELGITNGVAMETFKTIKCAIGRRPMILFNGGLFNTKEEYMKLRNILVDFFRGEVVEKVDLTGLEHVISVTAGTDGTVHFRVYIVALKKSGSQLPRVELEEMGPRLDLVMRRFQFAHSDVWKEAVKTVKPKKVKNIVHNETAQQVGRIHMQKQDLDKLQTRKMKGLKRGIERDAGEDDETMDDVNEDQVVSPKPAKKRTKNIKKK